MDNITRVFFKKTTQTQSQPLYQYDYGQILKFSDIPLPSNYEVHFSNRLEGEATIVLGNKDGVAIPD